MRLHFKAAARRGLLQHHKIAGAARAEAEIVAHQHPAHAQPAHQDALDEILARVVCASSKLKRHTYTRSTPHRRQQLELFAQRRQPRRRLIRREKFARMRLERHHARRQVESARGARKFIEHRLMPEMHAIEITDSECDWRVSGRRNTAGDAHGSFKRKSLNYSVI